MMAFAIVMLLLQGLLVGFSERGNIFHTGSLPKGENA